MNTQTTNINTLQPSTQNKLDEKSKLKLQRVVKDFEAIMVGYLLKSMRSSQMDSDGFGENYGGDMLEGVFDGELAKHISQNSSFGLGEMLYLQLTGEALPKQKPVDRIVKNETVAKKEIEINKPENFINKPVDSIKNRIQNYENIINQAATKHRVDSTLIKAVIASESAGKVNAKSPKNAKGLMQMIDSTASEMGVKDVWNPVENIDGGTKYLAKMLKEFQYDVKLALAAYNAGPGAVEKHSGVPPYKETKDYIEKVMNFINYFKEQEKINDKKD